MNKQSLLGLIFAGCAAAPQNLEFTVETGAVTINGKRIAGATQKLGPTGKGEVKLVQKGEDPNKYAVIVRYHDSDGDKKLDYRDFTRADQIGLGPYRVELTVNSEDCLVTEFEYKNRKRVLKGKPTIVKCKSLEN